MKIDKKELKLANPHLSADEASVIRQLKDYADYLECHNKNYNRGQ